MQDSIEYTCAFDEKDSLLLSYEPECTGRVIGIEVCTPEDHIDILLSNEDAKDLADRIIANLEKENYHE